MKIFQDLKKKKQYLNTTENDFDHLKQETMVVFNEIHDHQFKNNDARNLSFMIDITIIPY